MPYKKHRLQGKCHRRKQQRHESLHRQHVHDIQGAVSKSQEIHRQPLVRN